MMPRDLPEARPILQTAPRPPRYTGAPKRVLIVEDNLDSVRALVALVRDFGHTVQYAINGYAALEIARRFHPDFVLLDLGLPGMDGFEVCNRLKRETGRAHLRVIVVSGYSSDNDRAKSRVAGCERHLVKPVNPDTLFDVLES